MSLKDRVAIVAGGNSGIGQANVLELARLRDGGDPRLAANRKALTRVQLEWSNQEVEMAPRIVVGLFESKGIAEDACNRLKTEGVPAGDIVLKVLKEIGPIPSTMEPELEAGFLGPVILGSFRESFAHYIRNGETLVCVQALTDQRIEAAVDTLKQYAPLEVKVVPSEEIS